MSHTIGIVLPSRNRPAGVRRAVASLLDLASKPERVTVFVGLDADDASVGELDGLTGAELVVRERSETVAKTIDNLAAMAEQACDCTLRIDDDHVMVTQGWDEGCEQMTGLGFWYPEDPQVGAGFMSLAGMSSEMARWLRLHQGFVHAPWFPFWFTDTWLNEIGDMAGMKAPLRISVAQPDGRGLTHGLGDIGRWATLFEHQRSSRKQMASNLIFHAYPAGVLRDTALATINERETICEAKVAHLRTPEFIARWEKRAEPAA